MLQKSPIGVSKMFLLGIFLLVSVCGSQAGSEKSLESFLVHELVPDILSHPPASLLAVSFPSGVDVLEGNELTIEEVEGLPLMNWGAEEGVCYTIIMCDADAPSRADPSGRSFLHWLVTNAQQDDVNSGDTLVDILNSHPGPGTGLHRYVFLVYRQAGKLTIEDSTPNATFEGRVNFSPDVFGAKYKLGDPIAGNFYQTQNYEE